jgi:translation elongation factor EF-G
MKQLLIITTTIMALSASCNNAADNKEAEVKTHADSLMDEVMEGHDEAMGKTNKLSSALKLVQQSLDSINKLSPKLKNASAAFKIQLDSLSAELKYAGSGMDKWMEEFNMDSAKNDIELRNRYLESEKEKVFKIKKAMVSALQKTDSLLKK